MENEFIVRSPVMLKRGERKMDEYIERLIAYRTAMSVAKAMMKQGIISEKEYGTIDTIIAKKYGISLSSIFH